MNKVIIATLSILFSFHQAVAQWKITETSGLIRNDKQLVEIRTTKQPTSGYSMQELNELLKELYRTNHYEHIKIEIIGNSNIKIVAQRIQSVDEILVDGLDVFAESVLLSWIGVKKNQLMPQSSTEEMIKQIHEQYKKVGYLNTKVSISTSQIENAGLKLRIDIDEGKPCLVQNIQFITENKELEKQLQDISNGYLNEPLKQTFADEIRSKVLAYFMEERYLNASIEEAQFEISDDKTKVSIRYQIENPQKYLIFYYGNQFFDSSSISKGIRLNTTERFGLNPSSEVTERVRMFYVRAGFANAAVQYKEILLHKKNIKKLIINVHEGLRVRIKNIEILGKYSRDSDYYVDFIENHSSELISLGYFNSDDIDTGFKNLINELQNDGFLQAKLQSARTEFTPDGQYANIKVFLDEGPRTIISSLRFKNLNAYKKETLTELIGLHEGQPLNLNKLEDSIVKIKEYYAERGYLDIQVLEGNNEFIQYNDSNTSANIVYDLSEGPLVRVSSILIQGNEQTQEYVIHNEIDFEKGDILTSTKISTSKDRLERLGPFNRVNIRTLEKGTPISERTAVIEVSEGLPGYFRMGGMVNNEIGESFGISLLGYSGIGYRNLEGTARGISLSGEANYNLQEEFIEHDITTGYREPFMFGTRTRGLFNLSRSVKIFKRESSRAIALGTTQVSFNLERELTKNLRFYWNTWSFTRNRKYAYRGQFEEENLDIATIGPTIEWDKRDDQVNPSSGFYTRHGVEYSNPFLGSNGSIHYFKTNSTINTYVPLVKSKRLVWANSLRGGYIRNLISSENGRVPEEVMFSLGGRSTIRGFEPASIPPRIEFLTKQDLPDGQPMFVKFSSHYILIKTEFRFPIFGDFGGVLFYDGGTVKIEGIAFEDDYRDAAGFGFRFKTPVGPVSAEFAWKLDRRDYQYANQEIRESPFRFNFSIGSF